MSANYKSVSIQYLPIVIFLLLSISLYFPQVVVTSPLIGLRSQIASILVSTALIIMSFLYKKAFRSISTRTMLTAFVFPALLLLNGIANGKTGLAFFGNSDRSLGIVTYLTCAGFFLMGSVLKGNFPDGIKLIILLLGSLQVISLFSNYFGIVNDPKLGNFLNSNPNSVFTGLLLVLVLVWVGEYKKKSTYIVFAVIFLLSLIILLWIGAIQSILGFLVTLAAYGIFKGFRGKLKLANVFLLSVITSFLAFLSFVSLANTPPKSLTNSNSFYERLDIYKTSLKLISNEMLFGIGVDQYNLGYYRLNFYENIKLVDNAHSIPLQLWSTLGIFGLLLFYGVIYQNIRLVDSNEGKISIPITFTIVFYLISGVFAIQNPGIEAFVFFLLGFLGSSQNRKTLNSNQTKVVFIRTISILSIIPISLTAFAELQTSKALAGQIIPLTQTNSVVRMNSTRVYDIGLLLKAGEYSINVGDKELGLTLLQRMMKISPLDQRTIALALLLAEKYQDESLRAIGIQLNEKARS